MEKLYKVLNINDENAVENLASTFELVENGIFFTAFLGYDTPILGDLLVDFVVQKLSKTNIKISVFKATDYLATVQYLQIPQPTETLRIVCVQPDFVDDDKLLSFLNLRRDKVINEAQKLVFVLPKATFQKTYTTSSDFLSRATFTHFFEDQSVYYANITDLAMPKRDAAIERIKQEFDIFKVKTINNAIVEKIYELACEADKYSDEVLCNAILDYLKPYIEKDGKNQIRVAEIYELRARCISDTTKALHLHKKAEKIYKQVGDNEGLVKTYLYIATILRNQGNLDEALKLAVKAEQIAERIGDIQYLAASYSNQAAIYDGLGMLERAMKLYQKEEYIQKNLSDIFNLAICQGNQAKILYFWGRLEEAMQLRKQEEYVYKQRNDLFNLAVNYGNQALILYSWGRLEEAMKLYKIEEEIKKRLNDKSGLANCYNNQANILVHTGQFDQAMNLYKNNEQIHLKLNDKLGLAMSYGNQACVLINQKYYTEASQLLQKEEVILRQIGDKSNLANCYANQADILEKLKQMDEAMQLYKKQEKIAIQLNNKFQLAESYCSQASVLGTLGKTDEAMSLYRKAELISEKSGYRQTMIAIYHNQGELLAQKLNRPQEGLVLMKKALAIAQSLQSFKATEIQKDVTALEQQLN